MFAAHTLREKKSSFNPVTVAQSVGACLDALCVCFDSQAVPYLLCANKTQGCIFRSVFLKVFRGNLKSSLQPDQYSCLSATLVYIICGPVHIFISVTVCICGRGLKSAAEGLPLR